MGGHNHPSQFGYFGYTFQCNVYAGSLDQQGWLLLVVLPPRLLATHSCYVVRFPASLAFGSESGLQYPYKWGIFLCSPPARTIVAEHGQLGAYWISEHLSKPLAQSHFCSLTGLAASTQVLSSSRSQLLLEADISLGFVIFSFHISHQLQFWICEQARWSCRTMVT